MLTQSTPFLPQICGEGWAFFWTVFFPWLFAWMFYNGGAFNNVTGSLPPRVAVLTSPPDRLLERTTQQRPDQLRPAPPSIPQGDIPTAPLYWIHDPDSCTTILLLCSVPAASSYSLSSSQAFDFSMQEIASRTPSSRKDDTSVDSNSESFSWRSPSHYLESRTIVKPLPKCMQVPPYLAVLNFTSSSHL